MALCVIHKAQSRQWLDGVVEQVHDSQYKDNWREYLSK